MIAFNLYKGKKGCTYSRRHKTKVVKNKISGHSWNEHIPMNVWDIESPQVGVIQSVRSEEKAIRLCREYGESHIYLPLTQRELDSLIEKGFFQ